VKRLLPIALVIAFGALATASAAAEAPHLKVPVAKQKVTRGLAEGCAGECTTAAITACIRKNAATVYCRVRATYPSGEACRANVRVEKIPGEGAIAFLPGGSGGPRCEYFLYPPKMREELEREEGRHSS
jgi:hypothetical protein